MKDKYGKPITWARIGGKTIALPVQDACKPVNKVLGAKQTTETKATWHKLKPRTKITSINKIKRVRF